MQVTSGAPRPTRAEKTKRCTGRLPFLCQWTVTGPSTHSTDGQGYSETVVLKTHSARSLGGVSWIPPPPHPPPPKKNEKKRTPPPPSTNTLLPVFFVFLLLLVAFLGCLVWEIKNRSVPVIHNPGKIVCGRVFCGLFFFMHQLFPVLSIDPFTCTAKDPISCNRRSMTVLLSVQV